MPFEPGKSGNPGGRPKTKEFASGLRLALKRVDENDPDKRTKIQQIIDKAVELAVSGEIAMIREIMDRLDGKVPQGVIGGDDDDPAINFVGRIIREIVKPDARSDNQDR